MAERSVALQGLRREDTRVTGAARSAECRVAEVSAALPAPANGRVLAELIWVLLAAKRSLSEFVDAAVFSLSRAAWARRFPLGSV